jgi:transcriptional regulator with XRE-family HTH domain
MKTFGEVIYEYRARKGLTLREFAKKLGKSPAFISMMEDNKNVGTAKEETLNKIAEILSINKKELFRLAEKVPRKDLQRSKYNALIYFRDNLREAVKDKEIEEDIDLSWIKKLVRKSEETIKNMLD